MNETIPTTTFATALVKTPVEQNHYVFVGEPKYFEKLDCKLFDTLQAPHRRPPRGNLHDTTEYPSRLLTRIEILDIFQGAKPTQAPCLLDAEKSKSHGQSTVAFALGQDSFMRESNKASLEDYDECWCEYINAIMTSPYVVIHAYKVSVDRGNSEYELFQETWGSLGTDPRKGSRGFKTREEAVKYAKSLVEPPSKK